MNHDPPPGTRGVVYVASGRKYLEEAGHSAASVRQTNPDLPIGLVTDDESVAPGRFDHVLRLKAPRQTSFDKLQMVRAPWERTLFLDTDTLVHARLDSVFALLDRFDFAAVQRSSGYHYALEGVPQTFPEFNSGVIAFRQGPEVEAFFRRWAELYDALAETSERTFDQKSLRAALYASPLRIANLPPEYNFMPYFPGIAMTGLMITHGRPFAQLERLRRRMDRHHGRRAWVPGIGAVRGMHATSFPDLVGLTVRAWAAWLTWGLRSFIGRQRQKAAGDR